jgi:alkylation response protein AidB-like acyl-CoA dehydrogenase
MIDFTLSPDQNAIRSKIAALSSAFLASAHTVYEKHPTQKERFQAMKPFYHQAVQAGLITGLVPKSLGGTGGTVTDAAILVEAMVKVDRSLSMTIFSTGLGLSPLLIAGSEYQRDKFLRPFLSGNGEPLASLLHSEPHGTANWLEKGGMGLQTIARKEGNEWIISGEKVLYAGRCITKTKLTSEHRFGHRMHAAGMTKARTYSVLCADTQRMV